MTATRATLLTEIRAQLPEHEARWLLTHTAGREQPGDNAPVDATAAQRLRALAGRRANGEPLAYVLGSQPFRQLELTVTPDVLIPRPETEELVDYALGLVAERRGIRALDLGTGSGAIALALAQERPDWRVTASERDPAALSVARANGQRLGLKVEWVAGDWLQPLTGQVFDLIVSNPPYVADPDPDLATDVAAHEPAAGLRAGGDGLAAIRVIARDAPGHLAPGGWLIVEHGARQAVAVAELLRQAGLETVTSHDDTAGHPRATCGRQPERPDG